MGLPRGGFANFKAIATSDYNGDGKADIAGIDAAGDMRLYTGDGTGQLTGGTLMWLSPRGGFANFKAIATSDYNGDGRADIAGIDAAGDMRLYTGDGTGQLTGGTLMWASPRGGFANFKAIATSDYNGDGRADIAGIDAAGDMRLYTGDGTGQLTGGTLMWASPRGGFANFKAIA